MKKMNSRIAWILALVLLLSCVLCACGSSKKGSAEPAATPTPAPTAEPATPEPTAEPTPTPEPTPEPVTIKIMRDGQDVSALTMLSSSVLQLTASASNGALGGTWSSEDASVASVDANGVVSCWKTGSTRILYTLGDNSAAVTITITEPTITLYLNGTLAPTDVSMNNTWGMELTFEAVVSPEGEVTWSSDDETVATAEGGKVVAHHMGTTTVHCKCGTARKDIIIRVKENPYNNYVEPTPDPNDTRPRIYIAFAGVENDDFTITEGTTIGMACLSRNFDLSGQTVTWEVDDESIATVQQNGLVTGVKKGWTIITVTCGDLKDTSVVRVVPQKP